MGTIATIGKKRRWKRGKSNSEDVQSEKMREPPSRKQHNEK